MKDAVTLKISLPKIPDVELVAIEGLDRLAHYLGVEETKIGEARVLVTEAIINALEHSGGNNRPVKVEFIMTKDELNIRVKDYGTGFEPSAIEDPDIRGKMGTRNKRGWGLKLMKAMSDGFQLESGKKGTRVSIKKRLK